MKSALMPDNAHPHPIARKPSVIRSDVTTNTTLGEGCWDKFKLNSRERKQKRGTLEGLPRVNDAILVPVEESHVLLQGVVGLVMMTMILFSSRRLR